MSDRRPTYFRDQTSPLFEIFVWAFTLLPVLILIYFYPSLPERVPEYLNLHGDVEVWGHKSLVSVFRLALMGIDMQLLCLLTKYGLLVGGRGSVESRSLAGRLFDWFRVLIVFKLGASALDVIFFSYPNFRFLATVVRTISWTAAILGIAGGCYYSYRLLAASRQVKLVEGPAKVADQNYATHLRGRVFYYNRHDPSMFVDKHLFNLANKWVYVFILCLVCLPLLMFWPMLSS
jgi:uncharacterized membrane protein